MNDKEIELMNYFDRTCMKKYKKLFNYGFWINNILKIPKLYIHKKGDKSSENDLLSNLKSLKKCISQIISVNLFMQIFLNI